MEVRPAGISDLDQVVAMRMQLFHAAGEPLDRAAHEEALAATCSYFREHLASRTSYTFVAEDGDQIVGTGTLVPFERPPYPGNAAGREAYLLNMYTVPSHRRRGVARSVLDAALAAARDLGCKKVWLHATDAGVALYRSAGFSPSARYMERLL